MKQLLTLLLFALGNITFAEEPGKRLWQTDLDTALKRAKEENRLVLLDFTARWCGPCQTMNRVTFQDQDVLMALERVIPVKIEFDENRRLAQRYEVSSLPTLLLVDHLGVELHRGTGMMNVERFLDWLDLGISTTGGDTTQLRLNAKLEALEARVLEEGEPALAEVFKMLEKSSKRESTSLRALLATVAQKKPELLIPWLNAPALYVRIAASNALGEKIPTEAGYDAWGNAESRAKALALMKSP